MKNSLLSPILIVHTAIVLGLTIFLACVFFLRTNNFFSFIDHSLAQVFTYVLVGLCCLAILGHGFLHRSLLPQAKAAPSLSEKLDSFRSFHMIRVALTETPGLFAMVAYLMTGNSLFLYVAGGVLALLVFLTPTASRVGKELSLTIDEQSQLTSS
jgi:predicted membrane protein